ncbi:MAG: nucleotidyltransferase domain-containing protein [Chloroflexota bacterium]
MTNYNPNLILSAGTRIVTHHEIYNSNNEPIFSKGTVGIIIKSPIDATHAYRVRFMDETEVSLKRTQFSIYSHFKNPTEPDDIGTDLLSNHVIYRCVVGSQAYGLDRDSSDIDIRGIYLPPADLQWSLYGVPQQLDHPTKDEVFWEIQKFIMLALKANPNILECLYTPIVQQTTPLIDELLSMRHIFMCKLIYQTYNGYVMSQFKRMNKHLENHGEIRWKHAMHLIRLLLAGITALREGHIIVEVQPQYRDNLLSIRDRQMSWEHLNRWCTTLHNQLDEAYKQTQLPDRPDYESANNFLIKARREAL